MDPRRFDSLARSLATPKSRRGFLGSLAALGAGLLGARAADAQVSQTYCGNQFCASNPGGCKPGCVCCVYTNSVTGTVTNSRCRPPGTCSPGTQVGVATTPAPTTTAAPTTAAPTTTPAPTTTAAPTTTTTTTARPTTTTAQPTTTTAAPATTTTTAPATTTLAPTTTTTAPTTTTTTAAPACGAGLGQGDPCGGPGAICLDGVCCQSGVGASAACDAAVPCCTAAGPSVCQDLHCCRPAGAACTLQGDCCAGLACNGGACGAPTTTTTAAPTTTTTTTAAPCADCGPGQDVCLANGSCAQTCSDGTCPDGCFCSGNSGVGNRACVRGDFTCDTCPPGCLTDADCPQEFHCQFTNCGPGGQPAKVCMALCGSNIYRPDVGPGCTNFNGEPVSEGERCAPGCVSIDGICRSGYCDPCIRDAGTGIGFDRGHCDEDSQCCSGRCIAGFCRICATSGQGCFSDADCCGDFGRCVTNGGAGTCLT